MIFRASDQPRPQYGGRGIFFSVFAVWCGLASSAFAQAAAPVVPALDAGRELANIKHASILDDDAADAQAVRDVCTRCHSSAQFLVTPRSSRRWTLVFQQMTELGASPTEEQIDRIIRYFQRNLTVVNVNTSPAEELAPTLQVRDEVARAIVLQRMQKKFTSIAELAAIAGVDKGTLVKLAERLQF
jgi:hypothetical protein